MSIQHGVQATIYASGYDLTAFIDEVQAQYACDANDASVLQNTKKVYQPGLEYGSAQATGKWRADTTGLTLDQVDDVFAAALASHATGRHWIFCPQGDALGNYAIGFEGVSTDYEIDSPVADLIKTTAKLDSCKSRDRLAILNAYYGGAVLNAGGNGASVNDVAADTTNGGVGYVMVPVLAAATSITFKIQHSTDGVTWADLVTFAASSAVHDHQRVEVTGTVHKYLRAIWTVTGAPAAQAFVGFGRY